MILQGDALQVLQGLAPESVQMCVTSPPYWGLRDYGVDGQLGLESTPDEYIAKMVAVFAEVRRVLKADGTLWLNIGDSYATGGGRVGHHPGGGKQGEAFRKAWGHSPETTAAREAGGDDYKTYRPVSQGWTQPNRLPLPGLKAKDLIMIPARLALALQADGWWLRSDIIWAKPNPMPESVTDRPTSCYEHLFLLAKGEHYYYDANAISEASVGGHPSGVTERDSWQGKKGDDGMPESNNRNHQPDIEGRRSSNQSVKVPWPGNAPGPNSRMFQSRDVEHANRGRKPVEYEGKNIVQPAQDRGRRLLLAAADWREQGLDHDHPFPRVNKRNVWTIPTVPRREAHFATFPDALVEPCILAGSRPGDVVLDPFAGRGTVGVVAKRFGREHLLIELNPDYVAMAERNIAAQNPALPLDVPA